MGWKLLSFVAGLGLGWNHFRLYHRMLTALMGKPADSPFRRLAVTLGLFRHIFTFAAGILLIRVARMDPFHLMGGLFVATVVYRVYILSRREQE